MKNSTKIIISVVSVIAIIVVVIAGTYAYWAWSTSEEQRTSVVISVKGATMTIDGGGNITTKNLLPTTCINTTNSIQRKIKVVSNNETNRVMNELLQLNIDAFTPAQGTLTDTAKANLKWALVELTDQTDYSSSTWKGCTTPTKSGTFSGFVTGNTITLNTNSLAAGATSTKYYELYIWLDSAYTYTNVGTVQSDPMQDLTLNLSWTGMLEQVADE